MGTTNEFERDLEDQAGLKRPGRVDLRVLQNTPDAGDGHPGVQRCFRNYLHEGGIEKDIQLLGFSILGDSVDINNAELRQLSLIGGTTISAPQWVFVGEADQSVKQADSPTFNGLTLTSLTVNGAITITGNVDGVDISDLKNSFDNHKASTGEDHTYINQDLRTSFSPTFTGLNINGAIVVTGNVDGVDVGDFKTDYDAKIDQNVKTGASPTFVGLTLSADLVTTSTVDGVDVSDHSTRHQSGGADETLKFVYDDDDPVGYDFDEEDLTVNGSWYTLDLDSHKTVPAGVVGFVANVRIQGTASSQTFDFKSTSQSNNYQTSTIQTVNTDIFRANIFISLDGDHQFQYRGNTNLTLVEVVVLWWIY